MLNVLDATPFPPIPCSSVQLTQDQQRHILVCFGLSYWGSRIVDFIEQWFRVSPDGGTGLFEVLILLLPLATVGLFYQLAQTARCLTSGRRRHG
jgi:hypothetical protein